MDWNLKRIFTSAFHSPNALVLTVGGRCQWDQEWKLDALSGESTEDFVKKVHGTELYCTIDSTFSNFAKLYAIYVYYTFRGVMGSDGARGKKRV